LEPFGRLPCLREHLSTSRHNAALAKNRRDVTEARSS